MITNIFKTAFVVWTVLLLSFLTGCHQQRDHSATLSPALPTATVRVEKAELQPLTLSDELVGTVRAKMHATLGARQTGRIENFPIKLGDKVQSGELIAELEAGEIKAHVEQAEAALEQAERDWKRVSSLFDAGSATRSERDAVESRLRITRASLAESRASLLQMRIVAPFDGVITKKWADAGDLATPGNPIVDIENPGILQIEIDIPESIAAPLALNSSLSIVGNPGSNATAVITELSPAFDPITRTRQAKLQLKGGSFSSGQFVRVSIPTAERKAILLPRQAVIERGQLELVFSLDARHARMHLVRTRPHNDGRIEILSGITAGQSIIVQGAESLLDGQPVEVKQ